MSSNVTLASTTDTPEQVQAALGITPEKPAEPEKPAAVEPEKPAESAAPEKAAEPGPKEPEKPAEPASAAAETAGDEDDDADPDTTAAAKTLATKRGRLQARIDELTGDKYRTKRELDSANAKVKELQDQLEALKKPETAAEPAKPAAAAVTEDLPKPKLEDFDSVEDHTEAMARWVVASDRKQTEARAAEAKAKEAADAREREQQTAFETVQTKFRDNVAAAKTKYPDWDAKMEQNGAIPVPPELNFEIADSDISGELLYHFASHPSELEDIVNAGPRRGLRKLGELEARLRSGLTPAPKPAEPTPPATPPTKPVHLSGAPDPVRPVGAGSTATGAKRMDEMDYQEFKRAREKSKTA